MFKETVIGDLGGVVKEIREVIGRYYLLYEINNRYDYVVLIRDMALLFF